jgi:pantoate--beta-alanine ligase
MTLRLIEHVQDMMEFRDHAIGRYSAVALVPTMGALHAGHVALVAAAQERAASVVVSIFVNPMQFGPQEDFSQYPRILDRDLELLSSDFPEVTVFAPPVGEIYPRGPSWTVVSIPNMTATMCGLGRPGHFDGVSTVVAKLLNIVRPQYAVFGQKDAQQLAIVRRMAGDLNFPVEIVGVPTVRESSGLAISSRNRYLTAAQKEQATVLYQALNEGREQFDRGQKNAAAIISTVSAVLKEAGVLAEYVALVDQTTLEPMETVGPKPALLALAAHFGAARLIDNVILRP